MKEKCNQGEISLRDYTGQHWSGNLGLSSMQLSKGKAYWMGTTHLQSLQPEVLKARVMSTRSVVTSHGTG